MPESGGTSSHHPVKVRPTLRHSLSLGTHAVLRACDNANFRLPNELKSLAEQIWDLRGVQGTYSVLGSKGGLGKTPLEAHLAAIRQMYTPGFSTLAVDTNENEGSTAYRLGVERSDTILLTDVLGNLELYLSHPNLFYNRIGRHSPAGPTSRTGLGVLPNVDFVSQDDQQRRHTLERGMVVVRLIVNDVFCDPGNSIRGFASIVPARASDVVLLPALANDEESFDRIINLVKFLEANDPILKDTIRSKGFVVVLGAKSKHINHYAEVLGWDPSKTFTVPFDYHMAMRAKGNVNIGMLRLPTRIALMKLLVAMLSHERNDYLDMLAELHGLPTPVKVKVAPVSHPNVMEER
jgi:hypothetical protein